MNERIKLLAKQCWDERPEGQLHFDNEKFAELVAAAARADEREACANMCMAVPRTGAYFARLIRARGTT